MMSIKRQAKAFERGKDLWFLIPESERTAVRVLNELHREGFAVSKATVSRWANQWRQVAAEVAPLIQVQADTANKPSADLSDIPGWARKALPERLWHVAKGKGLERVEDAAGICADAIGAAASQLAENLLKGDGKAFQVTVATLLTLASTMERVASARSMVPLAHRSFCEGDKLEAEAKKTTHSIPTRPASGSHSEIKPNGIASRRNFSEEDGALAAPRGSSSSPPRLPQ